jgi:beta-1,4-mannosyltransferase
MTDLVTFFPDWREDPYIDDLLVALADLGWRCKIVGRKRLLFALLDAICGRGTVHLHWFEGFHPRRRWTAGLLAWLYLPFLWLAGRRGRLVWTVHNLTPHEGYSPFVGMAFVALLARSCTRVFVHFDETRKAVVERFGHPDKVFVISPASYGYAHGPPVDRLEARASISNLLTESSKLFVQVGSLRHYKQPATTILAFRDAAPASAMLLVAGHCRDDAIKGQILEAAAGDPRIILRLERLSDGDLVAALCAADWSICPYVRVDNPGALNLSISYRCPVIAPRLPQLRELTIGHPAILYLTDGPARQRLGEAIAIAATAEGALSHGYPATRTVSRREQARQTAEQYLAARNRQPLALS